MPRPIRTLSPPAFGSGLALCLLCFLAGGPPGALPRAGSTTASARPPAARISGGAHPGCDTCHVRGGKEPPESAGVGSTLRERCVACHGAPPAEPGRDDAGTPEGTRGHATGPREDTDRPPPLGRSSVGRIDCLSCHAAHFEGPRRQLRRDLCTPPPGTRERLDAATWLCLSCHPLAGETRGRGHRFVRHPVGVAPGRPTAARDRGIILPLADVAGTPAPDDDVVTCLTCHVPHEGPHPFLLRWPAARMQAACGSCHPGNLEAGPALPTARPPD